MSLNRHAGGSANVAMHLAGVAVMMTLERARHATSNRSREAGALTGDLVRLARCNTAMQGRRNPRRNATST